MNTLEALQPHCMAAIRKLKSQITVMDGQFAALPLPAQIPASASPGQIVAMMQAAPHSDASQSTARIKSIKRSLKDAIAEAERILSDQHSMAVKLSDLASYLRGTSALPEGLSDSVALFARQTKQGLQAGVIEPAVIDEIERLTLKALSDIDSWFESLAPVKSAAWIAFYKKGADTYQVLAQYDYFPAASRRNFQRSEKLYREKFSETRRQHRANYYNDLNDIRKARKARQGG